MASRRLRVIAESLLYEAYALNWHGYGIDARENLVEVALYASNPENFGGFKKEENSPSEEESEEEGYDDDTTRIG